MPDDAPEQLAALPPPLPRGLEHLACVARHVDPAYPRELSAESLTWLDQAA